MPRAGTALRVFFFLFRSGRLLKIRHAERMVASRMSPRIQDGLSSNNDWLGSTKQGQRLNFSQGKGSDFVKYVL